MDHITLVLRRHIETLLNAIEGSGPKKARGGKTERAKAITSIYESLSKKSTIEALSYASKLELLGGVNDIESPRSSEYVPFLGWAELAITILQAVEFANDEALTSKKSSKVGSLNLKLEYMKCLRSVIKHALHSGPDGCIRPLVPSLLYLCHKWLSEPGLRISQGDQIWQCVRDMLSNDENRAMLTPPFIRSWVDVCFDQITGRGPLFHRSQIITNLATDVFQLLGQRVGTYDVLTQSTGGNTPAKMLGGDFGYVIICERCCMMLSLAGSMPKREAREVQVVAFRTLAKTLPDHCLDIIGSSGLYKIIEVSLKPILTSLSDRRSREGALSLSSVLLLLAPGHTELVQALRGRILNDLNSNNSIAISQNGFDVSQDLIDVAAGCISFQESLRFSQNSLLSEALVTAWIRVAHTIISRRVPSQCTSVFAGTKVVIEQCNEAAGTAIQILRKQHIGQKHYTEILNWVSQLVISVAELACKIQSEKSYPISVFKPWQELYILLHDLLMKTDSPIHQQTNSYVPQEKATTTHSNLLNVVCFLSYLPLINTKTITQSLGAPSSRSRPIPYLTRLLMESSTMPSHKEIEYCQILLARCGNVSLRRDGVKFQLLQLLIEVCKTKSRSSSRSISRVLNASSVAVALCRGECPFPQAPILGFSREKTDSGILAVDTWGALHEFYSYTGLTTCDTRIKANGFRLVQSIIDQKQIWKHMNLKENDGNFFVKDVRDRQLFTELTDSQTARIGSSSCDTQSIEDLEVHLVNRVESHVLSLNAVDDLEEVVPASDDENGLLKDKSPDEIAVSDHSKQLIGIKLMLFVANYLQTIIRLNLLSTSVFNDGFPNAPIRLFKALQKLLEHSRCVDKKILMAQATESSVAIRICAILCRNLSQYRDTNSLTPKGDECIQHIHRTLNKGVAAICDVFCELMCENHMKEIKDTIIEIENYAKKWVSGAISERNVRRTLKRLRRTSQPDSKRKIRRKESRSVFDSISSNDGSINMQDDDQNVVEDSLDAENSDSASDSMNEEHRKEGHEWSSGSSSSTTGIECASSMTISKLLIDCVRILPHLGDHIIETLVQWHNAADKAERKLSPDGIGQAAMISLHVDSNNLNRQRVFWDILLEIGDFPALIAIGKSLELIGRRWQAFEEVSQQYVTFHLDSLSHGKRKQYPLCGELEQWRIVFLDYSRVTCEKLLILLESRHSYSPPFEEMIEIFKDIIAVTETFRKRHAFRMPRKARISFLKFSTVAIDLVTSLLRMNKGSENTPQTQSLVGPKRAMEKAFPKFLSDSESIVRLTAAILIPRLMSVGNDDTVSKAGQMISEAVPSPEVCEDGFLLHTGAGGSGTTNEGLTDFHDSQWDGLDLTEREQESFIRIHESFKNLGARSKSYAALLAFQQISFQHKHMLPFCLTQIILRCREDVSILPLGYHIVAQLSAHLGYPSPSRMYIAHSRILLAQYFSMADAVEKLHKLPVELFSDCDHHREGLVYDWIRENQSEIIPFVLAQERSSSLDDLVGLATDLDTNVYSLLEDNVTSIVRIFPMQFVASQCERGEMLWSAINDVLNGKLLTLLSRRRDDVVSTLLRSVSIQPKGTGGTFSRSSNSKAFWRDSNGSRPPGYDPLVIAKTIDQLYSHGAKGQNVVPTKYLQGSLFTILVEENMDSTEMKQFPGFVHEIQNSNRCLIATLLSTVRLFDGPPVQPIRSKIDAFFCVGMLWKMLGSLILSRSNIERVLFYRLIAKGFECTDTASDAAWLLSQVQNQVFFLDKTFPNMQDYDLDDERTYQIEIRTYISTREEKYVLELLGVLSSSLTAEITHSAHSGDKTRNAICRKALYQLLKLCGDRNLWTCLFVNGPFPQHKQFIKFHSFFERSKKLVNISATNPAGTVLQSIKRLQSVVNTRAETQTATLILAQIQELNRNLTVPSLAALRDEIKHQAWRKSAGGEQSAIQDIQSAISSLLNICHHVFSSSRHYVTNPNLGPHSQNQIANKGDSWHYFSQTTIQEISECLSSLILLHPQASLYTTPHFTTSHHSFLFDDKYVDLNSRIKLSLRLLLLELQSQNPLGAECTLRTITNMLRTENGKQVLNDARPTNPNLDEYRDLNMLKTFRPSSRSRKGDYNIRDLGMDPNTGQSIRLDSLPQLLDNNLWTLDMNTSEDGDPCEIWLRTICTVLARESSCETMSLLSHTCFTSFNLSTVLFPYLLMDILPHMTDEDRAKISVLISRKVLINSALPPTFLKLFIHALDVLCQIGLHVTSTKGIEKWMKEVGSTHIPVPAYYTLEISYLEAARSALRSGMCFSAIRFAELYVDQKVSEVEARLAGKKSSGLKKERRISSCPTRDNAVVEAERDALKEVRSLIMITMKKINEMDGVHAFGYSTDLAEPVADIASLDGEWEKSISACEVVQRKGSSTDTLQRGNAIYANSGLKIDLNKEYSRFHSMVGLGTLYVASDYWEGLRERVFQGAILEKDDNEDIAQSINKLNDLRFGVAWKLEQWEQPTLISTGFVHDDNGVKYVGFHRTIYRSLQMARGGRMKEAFEVVSGAQAHILKALTVDLQNASTETISDAAVQHQILQVLKRTYVKKIMPVNQAHDAGVSSLASLDVNTRASTSIEIENHEDSQYFNIQQFSQEDDLVGNLANRDGFVEAFTNYNLFDLCSRDYSFRVACGIHNKSIHAEDLPIVVARCLNENENAALIAAVVSEQILRGGGSGAWTRSALSLGSTNSSLISTEIETNKTAWLLQEVQLKWASNEDARSRKQALRRLQEIIESNLDGHIQEKAIDQKRSRGRSRQLIEWESVEKDNEKVAYLRTQACQLATKWSSDLRTHEPLELFEMYLKSGLEAALACPAQKKLIGQCHYAMASFADTQIKSIDAYRKTRKYDEMVLDVKNREHHVDKLTSMKKEQASQGKFRSSRSSRSSRSQLQSGGNTSNQVGKDLDYLIRQETRKARMDRQRLENLNETYKGWQLMACKSFAASLRDGTEHDLRAAFRMIALWLDADGMRSVITLSLTGGSGSKNSRKPINVPMSKLLPLSPQLSSRLNYSEGLANSTFQVALASTLMKMAGDFPAHCLWQVLALSNSTRVSANNERFASLYRGDKEKKDAADNILEELKRAHGSKISQMKRIADAYIHLSETKIPQHSARLDLKNKEIFKIGKLEHVPVPTISLPINASGALNDVPYVLGFSNTAAVCAGLSKPLRVICIGSDGKQYPQMVKGRDDLRGDAVMEQLFMILNVLLEKETEAVKRNLNVRTYRIIPLSPFSGVMQFVSNTRQFKEILVAPSSTRNSKSSLHERYRPNDITNEDIVRTVFTQEMKTDTPRRVQYLSSIWQRFQPAFRYFFLENWFDPEEWFSHQRSYSRSVAVMSIVGFILGLGDRHLANILLDVKTGEVVHIDFGIAFEQGKELPTPEMMPFRLSRDIVDGFGIAGVEGIFRKCCEVTLSVMRKHKDVLLTVVEVLLHDPMFNWDLTPEVVLREHGIGDLNDRDEFDTDRPDKSPHDSTIDAIVERVEKQVGGSRDAQRALHRISDKLDGLEGTERLTVGAHVARLVDEAQAFHIIASAYPGWAPWL